MDPARQQEISERDQLWASLRELMPEIERLAAGEFDSSPRQQQMILLLAPPRARPPEPAGAWRPGLGSLRRVL
jgi:hypothetical protein